MGITKWKFSIVLWDDSGNKLLENKVLTVRRACRFVAKEYVKKQFSSKHFVELI